MRQGRKQYQQAESMASVLIKKIYDCSAMCIWQKYAKTHVLAGNKP